MHLLALGRNLRPLRGGRDMGKRIGTVLWVVGFLVSCAGTVSADSLTTINITDANTLANAIISGGAGGITITNAVLSTNTLNSSASSGTFSTVGTNNYGLTGSGAVISSGNAAQDGTTGAFINGVSTA